MPQAATSMKVHYSSDTSEWYTPPHIIERAVKVLRVIDLDPCSNSHDAPNVPALMHFTQEDNGLIQLWQGRVYLNPPYGRVIGEWTGLLSRYHALGHVTEAIALLPARTDTKWFRAIKPTALCFIAGRLQFSGYGNSAPFPSVAVYLGKNLPAFVAAFGDIGDIYRPITQADFKAMFNPADFDALRVAIERSADYSDMKARLKALQVVRDCAARFCMMADYPNNGYPFCPAPGCNRSEEPGLGYCAAHYELDADDTPNVFESAPVRLCQECGAAPVNSPYSRLCEACYAIVLDEIRAELAQEQAAIVDASDDALEIVG